MEKEMNETLVAESVAKPKTRKATTKKKVEKPVSTKTVDDIKDTDRVAVRNLCAWELSFIPTEGNVKQVTEGIIIPPSKEVKLKLSEIDSQIANGNELFTGIDGLGAHANLRIVDPIVREKVFGEPVDPIQLTEEAVIDLLAIDSRYEFTNTLSDLVVTKTEKRMIAIMCSDNMLYPNVDISEVPYSKLGAIERVSGIHFK